MSLHRWLFGFFVLTICSLSVAGEDALDQGIQVFTHCQSCHQIGKNASNGVGPELNGLLNRRIASVAGFAYSEALAKVGKQGEIWNKERLAQFLAGTSRQFANSKMPRVAAVADQSSRNAVITMLGKIDATGIGAPEFKRDPALPEAIANIKGDPEYGEYLAGECSTCHQADGSNQGIPAITGWPVLPFAEALNAYRVGARENPVMQNIAKALGDEEIAALAAYYSKQ